MNTISIDDFKKLDIRIGTVVEAVIPEWSHWVIKLTVKIDKDTDIDKDKDKGTKKQRDLKTEKKENEKGENTITIFAGIMHFFKPEDLIGKQFPFVVNLEPKKIGPEGDFSQGMMMAAVGMLDKPIMVGDEEVKEKPVLLIPQDKVPNGTKVS